MSAKGSASAEPPPVPGRWRRTGRRSCSAGRRAGSVACRAANTAHKTILLAGPRLVLEPDLDLLFARHACEVGRERAREDFFDRLDDLAILLGMTRPGADMREAQGGQQLADGALVIRDSEAGGRRVASAPRGRRRGPVKSPRSAPVPPAGRPTAAWDCRGGGCPSVWPGHAR